MTSAQGTKYMSGKGLVRLTGAFGRLVRHNIQKSTASQKKALLGFASILLACISVSSASLTSFMVAPCYSGRVGQQLADAVLIGQGVKPGHSRTCFTFGWMTPPLRRGLHEIGGLVRPDPGDQANSDTAITISGPTL